MPRCVVCPQSIRIKADAVPNGTRMRAAVAQRQRHTLIGMVGKYPDPPQCTTACAAAYLDLIRRFSRPAVPRCIGERYGGVVPRELAHGPGNLLQPGVVGKLSIENRLIRRLSSQRARRDWLPCPRWLPWWVGWERRESTATAGGGGVCNQPVRSAWRQVPRDPDVKPARPVVMDCLVGRLLRPAQQDIHHFMHGMTPI